MKLIISILIILVVAMGTFIFSSGVFFKGKVAFVGIEYNGRPEQKEYDECLSKVGKVALDTFGKVDFMDGIYVAEICARKVYKFDLR